MDAKERGITMTRAVIAGIYLGICALTDIRTRHISVLLSMVAALSGIGLAIYSGCAPQEVLLSVLPGLLLMALSLLSCGSVGLGDGIVAAVAGVFLGPEKLLWTWLAGSFFAAAAAGILLIRTRKGKNEIPYVPFLLAGYFAMLRVR